MLSYFSKTVTKAYNVSKNVILPEKQPYKKTATYKQIRYLQKYDGEVLPTTKLSQLATLSYELEHFELIVDILTNQLQKSVLTSGPMKNLKQYRNFLIVCSYLIKHGASAFVDVFRENIDYFLEEYLDTILSNYFADKPQSHKDRTIGDQIKNRARYIVELLQDKNKLLQEKQISMLVKKKIKIKQKENQSKQINMDKTSKDKQEEEKRQKVENFLQNYVWRYIGLIDDKIDKVAEILASKVEKYLMDETPQSFSIEDLDMKEEIKAKTEIDLSEKKMKEQEKFFNQRQNKEKKNADLLQFNYM